MKLLSFRYSGEVRFGPKVKKEEAVWDVLKIQQELQPLKSFPEKLIDGISLGMEFIEQIRKLTEAAIQSEHPDQFKHSFTDIEWLAPIPRPSKNIIGIGKNYEDHAQEMGGSAPESVVVFTKSPTTVAADEETVPVHTGLTDQYDYEGELAVVIGKAGRAIPKQMAYDYVFGYTIANDLTARDLQEKHQQYFIGKSLEGACPMGPYLISKDEIAPTQQLSIVTKVNDEVRQNSTTGNMIRAVDELISEISKYVALEPGDILLTGTPAGVGKGFNPPKFLKTGDTVKVSIEGIGTLVTHLK